jgi:hypothetical protein
MANQKTSQKLSMKNTECFAMTSEAAEDGVNVEDWNALMDWIEKNKGVEVKEAFLKRCESPM